MAKSKRVYIYTRDECVLDKMVVGFMTGLTTGTPRNIIHSMIKINSNTTDPGIGAGTATLPGHLI
jgi:hypothetical protein